MLEAVAHNALDAYIAEKGLREPHPDPVQELRDGWDMHVQFGLAHPVPFAIMAGDPEPRPPSPALARGMEILQRRMRNIALAGRLRTSEERAIALMHAVGTGTVLTLPRTTRGATRSGLSAAAREAVISAITDEPVPPAAPDTRGVASALRARLDGIPVLTAGERHLLGELLDRIAEGAVRPLRPSASSALFRMLGAFGQRLSKQAEQSFPLAVREGPERGLQHPVDDDPAPFQHEATFRTEGMMESSAGSGPSLHQALLDQARCQSAEGLVALERQFRQDVRRDAGVPLDGPQRVPLREGSAQAVQRRIEPPVMAALQALDGPTQVLQRHFQADQGSLYKGAYIVALLWKSVHVPATCR